MPLIGSLISIRLEIKMLSTNIIVGLSAILASKYEVNRGYFGNMAELKQHGRKESFEVLSARSKLLKWQMFQTTNH
ncbi:unnamed protein product [Lactuca virosa]|uniref:Uncharacterized protein n=1 Tax=Lactuca virosa TaxID=75947 RepID=A0AAU9MKZ2_9ASTR|nr:unnamed protein product [Lactuca virosa]